MKRRKLAFAAALLCLWLCGCGKEAEEEEPMGFDVPPPWMQWENAYYWINRDDIPEKDLGVDPASLTCLGDLTRADFREKEGLQNGKAYYIDSDGCQLYQDPEGNLYIRLENGAFWTTEWVAGVVEYRMPMDVVRMRRLAEWFLEILD